MSGRCKEERIITNVGIDRRIKKDKKKNPLSFINEFGCKNLCGW